MEQFEKCVKEETPERSEAERVKSQQIRDARFRPNKGEASYTKEMQMRDSRFEPNKTFDHAPRIGFAKVDSSSSDY